MVRDERSESTSSTPRLEVATWGALVLGAFVLLKCYAAAKFSLTTASALLTTAPLNVLLGNLTLYAYELFPLIGLAAVCWAWQLHRSDGWSPLPTALVFGGALAFALSPLTYLIATCGGLAAFLLVRMLANLRFGRRLSLYRTVTTFFTAAVLVLVSASLTSTWTPTEVVSVRGDPTQIMVGTVLEVDDNWTTILLNASRRLVRVHTDDVLSRQICHSPGNQPGGNRPLYYLLLGRSYASPNHNCVEYVRDMRGTVVAGSLS